MEMLTTLFVKQVGSGFEKWCGTNLKIITLDKRGKEADIFQFLHIANHISIYILFKVVLRRTTQN